VKRLVETGGRMIDTSPMYGRAEAVTRRSRPPSWGWRPARLSSRDQGCGPSGKEQGDRADAPLGRAGWRTEVIDLIQIHNLLDWRTPSRHLCGR